MIEKLELVLRATMSNGTLVEGTTGSVEPTMYMVEDARACHELNQADPSQDPPAVYDESLANFLLLELQKSTARFNRALSKDPVKLCLWRLCMELRKRNDPAPP